MKKIIALQHISLDGYMATPEREIDWVKLDDEMFDSVGRMTDDADTALYGRITWELMDEYWPTAADVPNPGRHEVQHSRWYKNVEKIVISKSMAGSQRDKTNFIGDNLTEEITRLKQQPGSNILMLGSPGATQSLMQLNLIDEFWWFINPIILGQGISAFASLKQRIHFKPLETLTFPSGVTAVHYALER